MTKRKFFVGGNWKCNGSIEKVKVLASLLNSQTHSDVEVVVAPPFVYLGELYQKLKKNIGIAAQNCYFEPNGAFTGEISAPMLVEGGIQYVILGHSERRQLFHEDDELIAKKISHAHENNLIVIACIGETGAERDSNKEQEVISRQLRAIIPAVKSWNHLVIAYEPVWAIGTGKTATPQQAEEMHSYIRQYILQHVSAMEADKLRIIYGGSVNEKNCHELARQTNIDGFLVGGASLKEEFLTIIGSYKSKF